MDAIKDTLLQYHFDIMLIFSEEKLRENTSTKLPNLYFRFVGKHLKNLIDEYLILEEDIKHFLFP